MCNYEGAEHVLKSSHKKHLSRVFLIFTPMQLDQLLVITYPSHNWANILVIEVVTLLVSNYGA